MTLEELQRYLTDAGIEWEPGAHGSLVAVLPGEKKLRTACALSLGNAALTVNAFVARRPDENHREVYRWLLEQNRRMYAVAFSLDSVGDIYLTGRTPLHALNEAEIDRILGSVLEYSDGAFNTILELGFASSIRKEFAWRTAQGLPTDNLSAFAHLLESPQP